MKTTLIFIFSVDPASGEVTCTAFDEYLDVPSEIKVTLSATISSKPDDIYNRPCKMSWIFFPS